MRSVLGSFGPFQDIPWRACQFRPVGGWARSQKMILFVVKIFRCTSLPKSISKCKLVLEVYFGPFWSKSKDMFFQKMAICVKPILAILALFLLTRAPFGPRTSKAYLFHPFRCKRASRIKKNLTKSLFYILGASETPKPTRGQKRPPKWLAKAKFGPDASHGV